MKEKVKKAIVLSVSSILSLNLLLLAGCSSGGATVKASESSTSKPSSSYEASESSTSKPSSSYSSPSTRKETDRSTNADGYTTYKYNDGSVEVTDGWGNAVRDNDGDGKVDQYTTDGRTWEKY